MQTVSIHDLIHACLPQKNLFLAHSWKDTESDYCINDDTESDFDWCSRKMGNYGTCVTTKKSKAPFALSNSFWAVGGKSCPEAKRVTINESTLLGSNPFAIGQEGKTTVVNRCSPHGPMTWSIGPVPSAGLVKEPSYNASGATSTVRNALAAKGQWEFRRNLWIWLFSTLFSAPVLVCQGIGTKHISCIFKHYQAMLHQHTCFDVFLWLKFEAIIYIYIHTESFAESCHKNCVLSTLSHPIQTIKPPMSGTHHNAGNVACQERILCFPGHSPGWSKSISTKRGPGTQSDTAMRGSPAPIADLCAHLWQTCMESYRIRSQFLGLL